MAILRGHLPRLASLCGFLLSGVCFFWGVLLLLNAHVENGSPAGDILIGSLGLISLVISVALTAVIVAAQRTGINRETRRGARRVGPPTLRRADTALSVGMRNPN